MELRVVESTGLVEVAHARSLDAAWSELPEGSIWLGHRALRQVPRVAAVWSFIIETLAR